VRTPPSRNRQTTGPIRSKIQNIRSNRSRTKIKDSMIRTEAPRLPLRDSNRNENDWKMIVKLCRICWMRVLLG